MTTAPAERESFDRWCQAHLSPEIMTVAARIADLLGPVALPALATLVQGAWDDGHDAAEVPY